MTDTRIMKIISLHGHTPPAWVSNPLIDCKSTIWEGDMCPLASSYDLSIQNTSVSCPSLTGVRQGGYWFSSLCVKGIGLPALIWLLVSSLNEPGINANESRKRRSSTSNFNCFSPLSREWTLIVCDFEDRYRKINPPSYDKL